MTFVSYTAIVLACCLAGFGCGELAGRGMAAAGFHYMSNKVVVAYVAAAVTGVGASLAAFARIAVFS